MASDSFTKEPALIFRLSVIQLAKITSSLPLFAFLSCVILSMIYNYEASTATHCRVPNYLPSISATIGGFTPQRYIWRICIALHSAPRFMLAVMHYNHYISYPVVYRRALYTKAVFLLGLLQVAENACLVMLSYVSSTENYAVHENSFIGFVACSEVYMLLTLLVFPWSRRHCTWSQQDIKSYRMKVFLCMVNLGSFATAVYFFFRHNKYCESGVYTYFCFCEYVVVVSNIAFHTTALLEFSKGELVFSENKVPKPKHSSID